MNTAEKGRRKEVECLKEYKEYLEKSRATKVKDTWHTTRTHRGGNDMFNDFDLAFLVYWQPTSELTIPELHFIQVKSIFSFAYYMKLKQKYEGGAFKVFLAVYEQKEPSRSVRADNITKLKSFNLYRVN